MKTVCGLILLILLVWGCGQKDREQKDLSAPAVITGRVLHREVYPRQKFLKVIIPSFEHAQTIEECEIKADGSFAFRFRPLACRGIAIETFVPYLFVRPGDSLFVEIDFQDLTKVTFSGTGGKLNQDLYRFTDGGGYYLSQHAGTNDFMLTPEAFRKKMEKERKERERRCEEFFRAHEVDPDLERWIRKGMDTEYYTILLRYGTTYSFYNRGDTVPEAFYDFIPEAAALYEEDVVHSGLFDLSSGFRNRVAMRKEAEPEKKWEPEQLAGGVQNTVLAQFLMANVFDQNLSCNDITYFEENREAFDRYITLPLFRETLLEKYETKKAYLTNPRPVSDAMLYGVNHESALAPVASAGMRKLQELVKKNAGKAIFINFWGGCPAALAELKPQEQLSAQYQGEEVEFISIAADCKSAREYAERQGLEGQNYFWTVEEVQDIMRSWHVTWSPYYLLINKEGVIIDYGSHLRPSSAGLKDKIEKVVGEPLKSQSR